MEIQGERKGLGNQTGFTKSKNQTGFLKSKNQMGFIKSKNMTLRTGPPSTVKTMRI